MDVCLDYLRGAQLCLRSDPRYWASASPSTNWLKSFPRRFKNTFFILEWNGRGVAIVNTQLPLPRGCQCFLGSWGLCDKEDCRREGYVRTRGGGKMRIGGQRLYRSHLRDCAAGQTHGQPVIDGTTSKLNSATTRLSRKTTDHCSPV